MRLGIDVDDVIYPWFEMAHAACLRAGITNGVEPSTWSPHEEYGCDMNVWLDVMARATTNGWLYGGLPIRKAIPALHALRAAGHTLHLVTARGFMQHGDLIRVQTVQWLNTWQVPHDSLTFSKDKTALRVDWFADDSERNVQQLAAAGVPTALISAPHNAHVDVNRNYPPHVIRRDSFHDFATDLLNGTIA